MAMAMAMASVAMIGHTFASVLTHALLNVAVVSVVVF